MEIKLSVIIPTYNERENIGLLIERLILLLEPVASFEIIVADDNSPDQTWERVAQLGEKDPRIRIIRRFGERGLAPAVIEGFHNARGKILAVLDADLQHDENLLVPMLEAMSEQDIVVGSRMVEGGAMENWSLLRRLVSAVATKMAHWVLHCDIKDPMSGFFMLRQSLFAQIAPKLDAQGFKILIAILAQAQGARVTELGYHFRLRQHGESKLSSKVIFDYLAALYRIQFGRFLPLELIQYSLVGGSGVFVNLGLLWLFAQAGWGERLAVVGAIEGAMVSNFLLNNLWTFRSQRLTGLGNLLLGFVKFNLVSALGAVINYSVTFFIRDQFGLHLMLSALGGIALATLWNFTFNRALVWRSRLD
ncbi:MAG: glycosyltransferase family 2 protein [bacterium]|nr:glycosyltransferase family 2 protein [bacterium]